MKTPVLAVLSIWFLLNTSFSAHAQDTAKSADASTIKAFSKFDFVPGEKIVWFEDFTQGEIGDFPAKWNTSAAGEIVVIDGKPGRWLTFTKGGNFAPELASPLPDNFTLEYDLLCSNPLDRQAGIDNFFTVIVKLSNTSQLGWRYADNVYGFSLYPGISGNESGSTQPYLRKNAASELIMASGTNQFNAVKANPLHVSVWRQKERVRVYLNEEKAHDAAKALAPDVVFNAIVFNVEQLHGANRYYVSNLRLAVGAPDTRNKLLTEGKWVTHGILFDVNSDKIKGESYGTLKSVATVLKENADLKVKIVGHTDSDGDDTKNLDLSKRRAASVKSMLAAEFGIDAGRMETDGKGETQPADKNDTPAGKANNRRVEFVKI